MQTTVTTIATPSPLLFVTGPAGRQEAVRSADQFEKATREKIKELMDIPIVSDSLRLLKHTLPPIYEYHNFDHTLDVFHEVLLFALVDGTLSGRNIELLAIAAIFQDAGYCKQYKQNKDISAKFAVEAMREWYYADHEIKQVMDMIQSTTFITQHDGKSVQNPSIDKLSHFLQDATVSHFGREDFQSRSKLLFEEEKHALPQAEVLKPRAFQERLLKMICNHQWKTTAARALREAEKQRNVALLDSIVLHKAI